MPVAQWSDSDSHPDLYWVLKIMLPSSLAVIVLAILGAFHKQIQTFLRGRSVPTLEEAMTNPTLKSTAKMLRSPVVEVREETDWKKKGWKKNGWRELTNLVRRRRRGYHDEESANVSEDYGLGVTSTHEATEVQQKNS